MEPKDIKQKMLKNLEATLSSLDTTARKYLDQYGISPSRIRRYRVDEGGDIIFLCCDENNLFYLLRAGPKTPNWDEIVAQYLKEH